MLERLSLEEALLRHTQDNWIVIGAHDVWPPKYLRPQLPGSSSDNDPTEGLLLPEYIVSGKQDDDDNDNKKNKSRKLNTDCMIVMGIGGKPDRLLNIDNVVQDNVLVVKRFSGGGTVVMDHNSFWTTLIGRTNDFPSVEPYPRSIMEWSADAVFGSAFDKLTRMTSTTATTQTNKKHGMDPPPGSVKTLIMDTKSCSPTENVGKVLSFPNRNKSPKMDASIVQDIPKFSLRENDYVLGGQFKMGGNAQSIVKGGWLHHTSFLWDYDETNMESYLKLPDKRPEYRDSRSHRDFLVPLSRYYGKSYTPFVRSIREACEASFGDLHDTHLPTVLNNVIDKDLGGMEAWFAKSRTRIVRNLQL
ncbi:lipoate-protein ligase A [Nitzschia inconspicua]|uniref:Lipoate-protein ligase A n=1 Tax=Nitzschia inconspicua TaxID=303405 RepID=A0A9K3KWY1_9STRA|nr:lipoate-protein ligase A [Nitzschia inconspicua]